MPTDIWNLGVLLWDMIEGKELFRHIHDQQGRYDAKLHLAEMIALLGPPPPEVIQRYQYMREYSWPEPVRREDDRVCEIAEEYFCGPFFDSNGRFLYEDLIPDRKLYDIVSFLEGEERESFLDLAKGMLRIEFLLLDIAEIVRPSISPLQSHLDQLVNQMRDNKAV
ncbi:hypothetical protein CBS147309_2394 [Penicillium roqueforti]|nr:hypothetical protein CBS147309_2394 [Penicillium roqueforti]